MEWLAFSLYRQGNYKEALLLCMSALVLLQSSLGKGHPHTLNCYLNLSVVYETRGIRRQTEDCPYKGKVLLSTNQLPQPLYNTNAVEHQNKDFLGIPRPTAVYQNNSAYIIGSGLQGLSVS